MKLKTLISIGLIHILLMISCNQEIKQGYKQIEAKYQNYLNTNKSNPSQKIELIESLIDRINDFKKSYPSSKRTKKLMIFQNNLIKKIKDLEIEIFKDRSNRIQNSPDYSTDLSDGYKHLLKLKNDLSDFLKSNPLSSIKIKPIIYEVDKKIQTYHLAGLNQRKAKLTQISDYDHLFKELSAIKAGYAFHNRKYYLGNSNHLKSEVSKLTSKEHSFMKESSAYRKLSNQFKTSYTTYHAQLEIDSINSFLRKNQNSIKKQFLYTRKDLLRQVIVKNTANLDISTISQLNSNLQSMRFQSARINSSIVKKEVELVINKSEAKRNAIYENEIRVEMEQFLSGLEYQARNYCKSYLSDHFVVFSGFAYVGEAAAPIFNSLHNKIKVTQLYEMRINTGVFGAGTRYLKIRIMGEVYGSPQTGAHSIVTDRSVVVNQRYE